jgi:hypothetical protein
MMRSTGSPPNPRPKRKTAAPTAQRFSSTSISVRAVPIRTFDAVHASARLDSVSNGVVNKTKKSLRPRKRTLC